MGGQHEEEVLGHCRGGRDVFFVANADFLVGGLVGWLWQPVDQHQRAAACCEQGLFAGELELMGQVVGEFAGFLIPQDVRAPWLDDGLVFAGIVEGRPAGSLQCGLNEWFVGGFDLCGHGWAFVEWDEHFLSDACADNAVDKVG